MLVRRRSVVLLMLVGLLAAIVPACLGYRLLRIAGGVTFEEAKVLADQVLFVGIVAGAALVLVSILFTVRMFNLSGALARIEDLNRVSGHEVTAALSRLGDVGESITRMYAQLNQISARKSTRIAAMDALLAYVLSRSRQRLLVVDPRGEIVRATPSALEFLKGTGVTVVGKSVDSVIPQVEFTRTRAAVGRSAQPWMAERSKFPVAVQPVFNDRNEVAYYIYYLGPDTQLVMKKQPTENQSEGLPQDKETTTTPPEPRARKDSLAARLRRFFGRSV